LTALENQEEKLLAKKLGKKAPIPLPIYVFCFGFNTVFALLQMFEFSADTHALLMLEQNPPGSDLRAPVWMFWVYFYLMWVPPSYIAIFKYCVVAVLLVLMPFIFLDFIGSFRKHAPKLRTVGDAVIFLYVIGCISLNAFVVSPWKVQFMKGCAAPDSGIESMLSDAKCLQMGKMIWAANGVLFVCGCCLPVLNTFMYRANRGFTEINEKLADMENELACEHTAKQLLTLGYEFRDDGRLTLAGNSDPISDIRVTENGCASFVCQSGEVVSELPKDFFEELVGTAYLHVGRFIVAKHNLMSETVPSQVGEVDGQCGVRCPVFLSKDHLEASRGLLIIQTVGNGIWDTELCIKKGLHYGTICPFLEKAKSEGYAVVVLNVNGPPADSQQDAQDAIVRVACVWERIIMKGRCVSVHIIAHAKGGKALCGFLGRALSERRSVRRASITGAMRKSRLSSMGFTPRSSHGRVASDATRRIRRIIFTDTDHSKEELDKLDPETLEMFRDPSRVVNYVPHDEPFGATVSEWCSKRAGRDSEEIGCKCISAEVKTQAETNFAVLQEAFAFFAAKNIAGASGQSSRKRKTMRASIGAFFNA
jgi:hypothetical protein